MRKKLVVISTFFFIAMLAACGSNDNDLTGNNENDNSVYDEAMFEFSLPDTSENLVNISPDGKTIYAYFTGIR